MIVTQDGFYFWYAEQKRKRKYVRRFIIFIGPTELYVCENVQRQNGKELIFHVYLSWPYFSARKKREENTFILRQFRPCAARLKPTISLGTKAFAAHAYENYFQLFLQENLLTIIISFFLCFVFTMLAFSTEAKK